MGLVENLIFLAYNELVNKLMNQTLRVAADKALILQVKVLLYQLPDSDT